MQGFYICFCFRDEIKIPAEILEVKPILNTLLILLLNESFSITFSPTLLALECPPVINEESPVKVTRYHNLILTTKTPGKMYTTFQRKLQSRHTNWIPKHTETILLLSILYNYYIITRNSSTEHNGTYFQVNMRKTMLEIQVQCINT